MSGIIRVNKVKGWFTASNQPFNDVALSWGARGIMGYLLSKPDGWTVRNHDLYRRSPDGKAKVDRYLKELKANYYLHRYRVSKGRGRIDWITEVYETKESNPNFTIPELSTFDNTTVDNSTPDISTVDKQGHIVSTESVSTNVVSTEMIEEEEDPIIKIQKTLIKNGVYKSKASLCAQAYLDEGFSPSQAETAILAHVATLTANDSPGLIVTRILEGQLTPWLINDKPDSEYMTAEEMQADCQQMALRLRELGYNGNVVKQAERQYQTTDLTADEIIEQINNSEVEG